MKDDVLTEIEQIELQRSSLYLRDGRPMMTPSESYNHIRCLYCGYIPGYGGRLNIMLINGEPALVCLSCETLIMNKEPS